MAADGGAVEQREYCQRGGARGAARRHLQSPRETHLGRLDRAAEETAPVVEVGVAGEILPLPVFPYRRVRIQGRGRVRRSTV